MFLGEVHVGRAARSEKSLSNGSACPQYPKRSIRLRNILR
jgi:hypothetical protein